VNRLRPTPASTQGAHASHMGRQQGAHASHMGRPQGARASHTGRAQGARARQCDGLRGGACSLRLVVSARRRKHYAGRVGSPPCFRFAVAQHDLRLLPQKRFIHSAELRHGYDERWMRESPAADAFPHRHFAAGVGHDDEIQRGIKVHKGHSLPCVDRSV
jgi:hypothetical protein